MRGRGTIGGWIFLRLLAIVHGVALASFLRQWRGLVGPAGILPAGPWFAAVHAQLGGAALWRLPSLCWWLGTGSALPGLAIAGLGAALLLFAGIAPGACLVFLWADTLSLMAAGQVFYGFQWDALLVETTLLAGFAAPWSLRPGWRLWEAPGLARALLGWLLFRLMLLSGLVKLLSGDPTWRNLTALEYHFQTQPLPTPLAWYAHHLPAGLLQAACLAMFAIELGAPLCLAAGRRARRVGALAIIFLQAVIALTGNYTYFNLLTAALAIVFVDDAFWLGLARPLVSAARWTRWADAVQAAPQAATGRILRGFAAVALVATSFEAAAAVSSRIANWPATGLVLGRTAPFHTFNSYGLFAVMTTERPELIFEGSDDGIDWRPYGLPHKPGALDRRPDFVAPGQPRLDWQLWFAALGPPEENPWVGRVAEALLRGEPDVLALFADNPFPDRPPHSIRVVRYLYTFSSPEDRRATGHWWERVFDEFYLGPVSLSP
jgi:hypothetical protein